mmetsp:Transcript_13756/g.34652  ORF Transcript_13756/g.34652 Transcript_13756/m.34652 type:complete len:310 (+) Transcript_13756:247-1176(+)
MAHSVGGYSAASGMAKVEEMDAEQSNPFEQFNRSENNAPVAGPTEQEDLLGSFLTNRDGLWSMCLVFDVPQGGGPSKDTASESEEENGGCSTPREGSMAEGEARPRECVETYEESRLYMDAGFMVHYSKFIEGFMLNVSTGEKPKESQHTLHVSIKIPRMFSPSRCSMKSVQNALATLYFPTKFPVDGSNLEEMLEVADFFEIPSLMDRCDNCLYELTRQVVSPYGTLMKLIWYGEKEWKTLIRALMLADRYRLPKSWNKAKAVIMHSVEEVGRLVDHDMFKRLSVCARLDILETTVRKHIMNLRHNWR